MGRTRVAVLMGGKSSEREVSLSTGRQVLAALDPARYDAFPVDTAYLGAPGWGDPAPLEPPILAGGEPGAARPPVEPAAFPALASLLAPGGAGRPDAAIICLHGRYGEDGTIQGMLELLEIPYTGSGVLASALAMNKIMAGVVLTAAGIPMPPSVALRGRGQVDDYLRALHDGSAAVGCPAVVKPCEQGSTIGISIVREVGEMAAALETALAFDHEILVEKFVDGIEITGPVLGNEELTALPLVEIVPRGGFYDYEAKYTPGATEEIVPARIGGEQTERAQELARRCHRALGCRGFSRTDMMVDADGIWVLEVNTIPGMTPTSLLPRSAGAAGISFPELVHRMVQLALEGRSSEPTTAARK